MGKEKEGASEANDDLDLFEDTDLEEVDAELVQVESDDTVVSASVNKTDHKLKVKKRLDAYLERKWFKDHGWDDDDDLFDDDFFSEPELQERNHP
ncbi:MAG: hypothetical protein ACR2QW_07660 [bacterium]